MMRWGLVPHFAKSLKDFKGFSTINARAESLQNTAMWRVPFQRRRCLIPADGFYEWRKTGKARQAFYFQMKDGRAFAFAGIWDRWRKNETSIKSCAIITTAANELLEPVHDRMPVILPEDKYELWLNEEVSPAERKKLLEPFASEQMSKIPVSSQVNYTDVDNEELIKRVDAEVGTTPSLF